MVMQWCWDIFSSGGAESQPAYPCLLPTPLRLEARLYLWEGETWTAVRGLRPQLGARSGALGRNRQLGPNVQGKEQSPGRGALGARCGPQSWGWDVGLGVCPRHRSSSQGVSQRLGPEPQVR